MCKVTISTFQFMQQMPTEQAAREWMEKNRWPNGAQCPLCHQTKRISARKHSRSGYYQCGNCKKEFTVRTGTVMERSHIPLKKWLYAMYLLSTARKGISSLQLSKELGITQKSAWFMLHRLRESCKDDGEMLTGMVEIDETYIGGKEKNRHANKQTAGTQGRSTKTKSAVIGMRERGGKVKAQTIDDNSNKQLQAAVRQHVVAGFTIYTDEHRAYCELREYARRAVHSVKEFVNGMASTNGIESVWALLKRGFYGTYHQFSRKHLRRYVDEFAFRLNEGNVREHTWNRIRALCNMTVGNRVTYQALIS